MFSIKSEAAILKYEMTLTFNLYGTFTNESGIFEYPIIDI